MARQGIGMARQGHTNGVEETVARESLFPKWDGVYCLVGTPPPPFGCKILKTNDLFCDYPLDL